VALCLVSRRACKWIMVMRGEFNLLLSGSGCGGCGGGEGKRLGLPFVSSSCN